MYSYYCVLYFADKKFRENIKISMNEEDKIRKAVAFYNNASKRSRHPKHIARCDFVESGGVSEIHLILESSVVLEIPNRALKLFTSYIAREVLNQYIVNGALFRGTSKLIESSDEKIDFTNEALLSILLHCALRNSAKDQELLNVIKSTLRLTIGSERLDQILKESLIPKL